MAVLRYSKNRQKWFRLKHHYADVLDRHGEPTVARTIRTCHEVSHLAGCKECHETRYILHKCGHRLCPICSYHVSRFRAHYLQRLTENLQHPKLITLTIPTQGLDYEAGFKLLVNSFRELRKDQLFKKIRGGAYAYEVVPHENYYHIHLHLLVDSPYIPREQLFAAWRRRLNVQYASVDIRSGGNAAAKEYIAKYPAKNHAISTDPDLIHMLYMAIKGRRLFGTFGTWYNAKLDDDPNAGEVVKPPCVCPFCGALKTFFWIRHGPFVFGPEAWKDFEADFLRGQEETITHEIIFEEVTNDKEITAPSRDATDLSRGRNFVESRMADALSAAGVR